MQNLEISTESCYRREFERQIQQNVRWFVVLHIIVVFLLEFMSIGHVKIFFNI